MTALRLTGRIAECRKYSTTAGSAVLELLIAQDAPSLPARARRDFGSSPAAHLTAERLTRHYRRGSLVTVTADGWRFDPKRQHIELLGADHIEHAEAPTHAD